MFSRSLLAVGLAHPSHVQGVVPTPAHMPRLPLLYQTLRVTRIREGSQPDSAVDVSKSRPLAATASRCCGETYRGGPHAASDLTLKPMPIEWELASNMWTAKRAVACVLSLAMR